MKIQKSIARSAVFLGALTFFLFAIPSAFADTIGSGAAAGDTTSSTTGDSTTTGTGPSFTDGSKIPVNGSSDFSAVSPTSFVSYIQSAGTSILNIVLALVAVVAVLFVVLYGFQYLTAGGDPEKAKKARGGLINAVIGVIIIASAFYIVDVALNGSNIFSGVAATVAP